MQGRIGRRAVLRTSVLGTGWVVLSACGSEEPGADGAPRSSSTGTAAATVPAPAAMIRTAWSRDPWALGSYSYMAVGAEPQLRAALAAPVADRLFFAGEATSSEHPATVHGALASGERVAAEVLDGAEPGDSVLVVGAGVAGVTAARVMSEAGMQVKVMEARDRVGGRLDTVRPPGWPVPIELGASWVHDVGASSLRARLEQAGVATAPFDYSHTVVGSDGERVEDLDPFTSPAAETVELAVDWASEREPDRSLAVAIEESGAVDETGVEIEVLRAYLDGEITNEFGASPEELSARWGQEEGTDGDDLIVVGGYAALASDAAEGLDIALERPIEHVEWDSNGAAVTDGSGQRVDADRIVVTIPLGVLQSGAVTFDPPLPEGHRAAIGTLGMGVLDKLWFRFDEQFWSDDSLWWTLVAPSGSGFVEWFNLAPVTGEPILLSLIGGPLAREWSTQSDQEVQAAALSSLQAFLDASG